MMGHVVAFGDDTFRRTEEVIDKINEMNDLRDEHTTAFTVPFAVPIVAVIGIWAEAAEIDGSVEQLSETTTV